MAACIKRLPWATASTFDGGGQARVLLRKCVTDVTTRTSPFTRILIPVALNVLELEPTFLLRAMLACKLAPFALPAYRQETDRGLSCLLSIVIFQRNPTAMP